MTSTESAAARDSPPGDRIQAGRANVALLRATGIFFWCWWLFDWPVPCGSAW